MKTNRFMLGDRMKIVISPAWGPKCGSRSPFLGLFAPRSALWADSGRTTAPRSWYGPQQVAQPHQIVSRASEQAQMVDLSHAADLHLAQGTNRLAPADAAHAGKRDALPKRVRACQPWCLPLRLQEWAVFPTQR